MTDASNQPTPRDRIGHRGERHAADYLEERDWTIVETNHETKIGELDIIARRTETLGERSREVVAFVEVKTRTSGRQIPPERNLTRRKRRKIVQLASIYLDRHDLDDVDARFDVIAVDLGGDRRGSDPEIRHYSAAFDALGRLN
jgi:putative endonuclease